MPQPYNIFIIYAQEDAPHLEKLRCHLQPMERAGILTNWCDRAIVPGDKWEDEIFKNMDTADIILLMVSSAYYESTYIHDNELKRALKRHEKKEATLIPIIVRPCDIEIDPIVQSLQSLPPNAIPVSEWDNNDRAWLEVVRGIRRVLEKREAPPKLESSVDKPVVMKLPEQPHQLTVGIVKEIDADVDITYLDKLLNLNSINIKVDLMLTTSSLDKSDINKRNLDSAIRYHEKNPDFENYDFIFYLTDNNLDNNFFTWDAYKNLYIITLHNWNLYTNLPKANGIVYFIFAIINLVVSAENTGLKPQEIVHYKERGCIADFLGDKTNISKHLRSANLCEDCQRSITKTKNNKYPSGLLDTIEQVLYKLSNASHYDMNVIQALYKRAVR